MGNVHTRAKPIPQRKGHPIWGSTLDFMRDQKGFILRGHEELGDVFCARVAYIHIYYVRDPEIVNAVNTTHWQDFYKPQRAKKMWAPFLGNGLVPADGPLWKRQHKLIMPAFHKTRVDAYAQTMVEYTEKMLARWQAGSSIDFNDEMTGLTLGVVVRTLFDADVEGDAASIREALLGLNKMLFERMHSIVPVPHWWPSKKNRQVLRAIEEIESVLYRFVEERRRTGADRGDLLSHMALASDEQGRMSEKQLRDEMMTLIFAGHETTAHALTWAWYQLAKHPHKAAKLREEIDRVFAGGKVTLEGLNRLEYAEMVIKEAMRLTPSVWIYGREAQREVRIGDYVFPKGASVTVSPYAMGRNPRIYDDPNEFRPERWTREFERSMPRGAYVPFAGGPRICLGKQFALMEMRAILAVLMQHVQPNIPDGFEPEFITELSMHPGPSGMPAQVRFLPARDQQPAA